jgi:conjugal transfer/entry exclusion protein
MQTELNMVDNLLKNIQQLEVVVSNKYNQCNESINEIDSLICTIESKDTIINNLRDNIYKKNTELLKLENKNRSLINEKTRLIKIDSLDNNNYCCIIS